MVCCLIGCWSFVSKLYLGWVVGADSVTLCLALNPLE